MKFERRDVVVASVGMVLVSGAMAAVVVGGMGYDGEDDALVFGANLALACLGFAFAGAGCTITGVGFLISIPSTKETANQIERIDAEILAYRATQSLKK